MSIIKNHLQIELSIDQILYRLRLLRLNEMQTLNQQTSKRPGLEPRSVSQSNLVLSPMMTIDEEDTQKRSEISDPNTMQDMLPNTNCPNRSMSTPMITVLQDNIQLSRKHKKDKKQQSKEQRRERNSTKQGLLMTKPE